MCDRWNLLKKAARLSALYEQEPMSRHTTFRVGGPADLFVEIGSGEELAQMRKICQDQEIPFQILGRGSNMLVGDGGYRGVIFHMGDSFSGISLEGNWITAEAGVTLTSLARFARDHSLTGLEFAAGIPGSLGGALVMNAGAYGGEMKDVVREIRIMDPEGNLRWISAEEAEMTYRHTRLMEEDWVAMGARMELKPGDQQEITDLMADLAERRRSKQPLEYPSAGSTFKRPAGYFAGKLIQDAGLAGYRVGGAAVSTKHCGFVVNDQNGSAADILQVCKDVAAEVKRQTGVEMELEVRLLGDF